MEQNKIVTYQCDKEFLQEQEEEKVRELSDLGINLIITSEPENLLDDSFSYVVKNPGIKLDHKVCLKAKTLNMRFVEANEITLKSDIFQLKRYCKKRT